MSARAPLAGRDDRCSKRSEAADEPLSGTASTLRRWLLVEHDGPWGRDGLLDARLPSGVGEELRALERRTGCRVVLIRRPVRGDAAPIRAFAVDTARAWIGGTTIADVASALDLDPADAAAFPRTVEGPVVVVCTHGRRDACCAERGRPLAAATAAVFPRETWESTHVGGDRFAANLVVFPHGLMFGRVEPERGPEVVAAYADGRIVLDRFRGRTCDRRPLQAADHAVRTRLGLDGLDDVGARSVDRDGDRAVVRLEVAAGVAVAHVERIAFPPMRLTCGSTAEESPGRWIVRDISLPA